MNLQTLVTAVEDSQNAKLAGAAKQVADQANGDAKAAAEAARLVTFAALMTQDGSDLVSQTTAADQAVDDAVAFLQSLKSTAVAPVPVVAAA